MTLAPFNPRLIPPVKTVVSPVPSFTITPNQTTTGTNQTDAPDYAKPGQTKNARPGDTVVYPYILTNTGNVNGESYTLTNGTVGGTGTGLTPAKYYPVSADTNNDGTLSPAEIAAATPITTITGVAKDGVVNFFQVYTIPTTATDAQTFGADPVGTRNPNTAAGSEPTAPYTQPYDSNNSNLTTVQRTDAVLIGPKSDANADGKNDTTGSAVAPYQSPDPTPVTITPVGDVQSAPATTTTTQVTFTNTVQNPGNRPDTFDITGAPANLPSGATVTYIDPVTNKPLTDTDGDGKPDTGPVPAGTSKDILVVVTFPAGSTTTDTTKQPTVIVTATSANDTTKSDPTTDKVLLPGVLFGDKPTTPGTNPDPTPAPTHTTTPPTTTTGTTTTPLTDLPLEIKNTGGTTEPFTPVGTVTFDTPNGPVTKPITYLPDANCDGTADSTTAITVTPPLAPGAVYCLIPVVDIPNNAYPGSYPMTQTVTGTTTGVTASDKNDTITIPKTGTPKDYITKTADKTDAKPGDDVTYSIVGINKSNANFTNTIISDKVPTNTTFKSLSASTTVPGANVLYRLTPLGGTVGAWTAVAPTNVAAGTLIEIGANTNGDSVIDKNDIIKPGQELDATFVVTVN
ncbi:DUF11 domain-containing protein [Deinococcus sp. KNUC1210]|uniref:DUF11 domain-containing protein n=1 Tax=Deinococcus sp. KNUC1210 TaxID=2917691 RepID=UPI001EF0890E|nr:DUF11 domain-containing protein [Deinococcus sp. KNUC1210]ULH14966.1 DUF11 domain-containing protein [Deinococcus sp. KNUC1210]